MQPTYLPWLGLFELLARADVFIFLDTAQYVHQEWNNRNRLKGSNGKPFWLTVPVKKHPLNTPIKDIEINSRTIHWRRKHIEAIRSNLGGTPFFDTYFPLLEEWYSTEHRYLTDLNRTGIQLIADCLGLSPKFHIASQLDVHGERTELLREICNKVDADCYYSPRGAATYLEQEKHILEGAGIAVTYQQWKHPVYPQRHGSFVSHMSAIDALMNTGKEQCRVFIDARSGTLSAA